LNSRILLLGLATTALTSCATAYKTGQTPDDVYYSPNRPEEEYVQVNNRNDDYRNYDYYSLDDYRLRMQIRNPYRYNMWADDWYYDNWYTSNSWRYGWNNPWTWNGRNGWYYSYNSWCYAPYPVYTAPAFTTAKTFAYKPPIRNFGNSNTVASTYNEKTGYTINRTSKPVKLYNNSNRRTNNGFGNFMRQILTPGVNNGTNSSFGGGNNNRTYNPSGGNSSGGSSGSSSSGSSARPARNGKG
jgi:hypothetical protein